MPGIGGPVRFLEVRRAVLADGDQTVGKNICAFPTNSLETLADRLGDGIGQKFAGEIGQLAGETTGLGIFQGAIAIAVEALQE